MSNSQVTDPCFVAHWESSDGTRPRLVRVDALGYNTALVKLARKVETELGLNAGAVDADKLQQLYADDDVAVDRKAVKGFWPSRSFKYDPKGLDAKITVVDRTQAPKTD